MHLELPLISILIFVQRNSAMPLFPDSIFPADPVFFAGKSIFFNFLMVKLILFFTEGNEA